MLYVCIYTQYINVYELSEKQGYEVCLVNKLVYFIQYIIQKCVPTYKQRYRANLITANIYTKKIISELKMKGTVINSRVI